MPAREHLAMAINQRGNRISTTPLPDGTPSASITLTPHTVLHILPRGIALVLRLVPVHRADTLSWRSHMKRRPVLPFLFIVLAVALFAAHSTAQALPPVPPDCSDTLSESEITAVAQYMIYDPDSEDPDWASCAATFNHTANDDALFAELDELGWTPEATPEGDIYPPDATPFPDENDLDQASLPPGGLELVTLPDSGLSVYSALPSDTYIDEYQCTYSDPYCWKQIVEKGYKTSTCPSGYNCASSPYCQKTTTFCDSDPDIDWRCTYRTSQTVNDPDTARIYSDGRVITDFWVQNASSKGHTNSTLVNACIEKKMEKALGIAGIAAHVRFRHDHE
jgi:hypothetical protein